MLTIKEILRGCEVGRIQTVGTMQVIPLTMDEDLQDDRFANPDVVRVGTSHYGTMDFVNPEAKPVLLPSHVGYVVKQAAQDHAMCKSGLVPARSRQSFNDAMCIQQSQGGSISQGQHDLLILPLALRESALKKRGQREFGRLWEDIHRFTGSVGISSNGNLVTFLKQYTTELDQFVAEFEIVDNQVGAIILINGDVVGVERAPSAEYWRAVWEPLVRVCYGSAAIAASRQAVDPRTVKKMRKPLKVQDLSSMDALCDALEDVERKQDEMVKRQVRQLLDDEFTEERDQTAASTTLKTVRNEQFFGQVAVDQQSSKVLYVSMVTREGWSDRRGWKLTEAFTI